MLEVIQQQRRGGVASASGTGSVIDVIGRRSVPLVQSPLFAARSAAIALLMLVVATVMDAAVPAVLRSAGIRVQRILRSPLATVLLVMVVLVVVIVRRRKAVLVLHVVYVTFVVLVMACVKQ